VCRTQSATGCLTDFSIAQVGIGSTTAIYTVIQGVLLNPFPYADPDRYYLVFGASPTYNKTFNKSPLASKEPKSLPTPCRRSAWGRVNAALSRERTFRSPFHQPLPE